MLIPMYAQVFRPSADDRGGHQIGEYTFYLTYPDFVSDFIDDAIREMSEEERKSLESYVKVGDNGEPDNLWLVFEYEFHVSPAAWAGPEEYDVDFWYVGVADETKWTVESLAVMEVSDGQ